MQKGRRPGIDPALESRSGVSRDGQPLSHNRLPSDDLAPWVAWLYATSVDMPADHEVHCNLLSDTAMIRIQLQGEWSAEASNGTVTNVSKAYYFGPQTRSMPVRVRGSFTSIGLAMKPGAGYTVTKRKASTFTDCVVPVEEVGLPEQVVLGAIDPSGTPESWLQALEANTRAFLCGAQAPTPPEISAKFERLALTDPTSSISAFAEEAGISMRQLERVCERDFGMTPKKVMRRARALDMAAHLRGVADRDEEDEAMLRYYDQSHMVREFTELFGMTPRQFVETPQPLMTLALESRQSRRLAVLNRIGADDVKPWRRG